MGKFRVYLKTFDELGNYQSEYTDVSNDVLSIGNIKQTLDNSQYDVGIFRFGSVKIKLRNDTGKYLDETSTRSIFPLKRQDTKIKVTFDINPKKLCVGFFKAGACGPINDELDIFEGLVTEITANSDVDEQEVVFDVLGFESIFDRVEVPYSSIGATDDISTVLETILDQTQITNLLTVSASNINPGLDQALDVKDDLENTTVKEALDSKELLFLSSSVLKISDNAVVISSRQESADVKFNFYGQASDKGLENVLDIKGFSYGINRLFNFWTWNETSLSASDITSIDKYGVRKRELSSDLITNGTKRQNILDENRDEFGSPKIEMKLTTKLNSQTIALELLDKVDIDYPTVFVTEIGQTLPVWGSVKWGEFRWPLGKWNLTIDQAVKFKIMSRQINIKDETITFEIREV